MREDREASRRLEAARKKRIGFQAGTVRTLNLRIAGPVYADLQGFFMDAAKEHDVALEVVGAADRGIRREIHVKARGFSGDVAEFGKRVQAEVTRYNEQDRRERRTWKGVGR